jgi:transposase InsO family protein
MLKTATSFSDGHLTGSFLILGADACCAELDIEHRLTKPRHPWTNGQADRMNRTIKDATVKRFHYESHGQLRQHLADFVGAYNFARRLKTLRGERPSRWIYSKPRFR